MCPDILPPTLPVFPAPAQDFVIWAVLCGCLIMLIAFPFGILRNRLLISGVSRRMKVLLIVAFSVFWISGFATVVTLALWSTSAKILQGWHDQQLAVFYQHGCSLEPLNDTYTHASMSVEVIRHIYQTSGFIFICSSVVFLVTMYHLADSAQKRQREARSQQG
jgi:hypothetical protein